MKRISSVIALYAIPFMLIAGGSGSGTGTGSGSGSASSTNSTPPIAKSTNTQESQNDAGIVISNAELRKLVDSDGNGKVSHPEIMDAIDSYFDGNPKYKVDGIMGLIDDYFDE